MPQLYHIKQRMFSYLYLSSPNQMRLNRQNEIYCGFQFLHLAIMSKQIVLNVFAILILVCLGYICLCLLSGADRSDNAGVPIAQPIVPHHLQLVYLFIILLISVIYSDRHFACTSIQCMMSYSSQLMHHIDSWLQQKYQYGKHIQAHA